MDANVHVLKYKYGKGEICYATIQSPRQGCYDFAENI